MPSCAYLRRSSSCWSERTRSRTKNPSSRYCCCWVSVTTEVVLVMSSTVGATAVAGRRDAVGRTGPLWSTMTLPGSVRIASQDEVGTRLGRIQDDGFRHAVGRPCCRGRGESWTPTRWSWSMRVSAPTSTTLSRTLPITTRATRSSRRRATRTGTGRPRRGLERDLPGLRRPDLRRPGCGRCARCRRSGPARRAAEGLACAAAGARRPGSTQHHSLLVSSRSSSWPHCWSSCAVAWQDAGPMARPMRRARELLVADLSSELDLQERGCSRRAALRDVPEAVPRCDRSVARRLPSGPSDRGSAGSASG